MISEVVNSPCWHKTSSIIITTAHPL